jgi:intracellular multiplication protein IcmC
MMAFKKYAESRTMMSGQHSIAKPVFKLVAAAILLALPVATQTVLLALWGTSSVMAYTSGDTGLSELIPPVVLFIRLVGVWAFMRGAVLLTRLGGESAQPGQGGKAVIHLLAGILCINIVATCDLIEWMFFGTS